MFICCHANFVKILTKSIADKKYGSVGLTSKASMTDSPRPVLSDTTNKVDWARGYVEKKVSTLPNGKSSVCEGSIVHLHDPSATELFIRATVVHLNKKVATLQLESGCQVNLEVAEACPVAIACSADFDHDYSDLTQIVPLHEPGVLEALRLRYLRGLPYTNAGHTLLAVNPFKNLGIYGPKEVKTYSSAAPDAGLPPHIFAVAERARQQRAVHGASQTIVVSGESGSGKTFSSRMMIKYLAGVSENTCGSQSQVARQLVGADPILEAFGNAQTFHNPNSSRFGKLTKIDCDESGRISGALIQTFLLERSRVTQHTSGEQNYHIFQQLIAGLDARELASLGLIRNDLQYYTYLTSSVIEDRENVIASLSPAQHFCRHAAAKRAFEETLAALIDVDFSIAMRWNIFKTLGAIIHLGNVTQVECNSEIKDIENEVKEDKVTGASETPLRSTARLLGVSVLTLANSISRQQLQCGSETLVKPVDKSDFGILRDTLAKTLYASLFQNIVRHINSRVIGSDPMLLRNDVRNPFIGLLDVFGFENNSNGNSLEQLCINFANEKLQHKFVEFFLQGEQQVFEEEGLAWVRVPFVDNHQSVKLISGPCKLFDLLDEECRLNRKQTTSSAKALVTKLQSNLGADKCYYRPKLKPNTSFGVKHYAGDITYNCDDFVKKNQERILPEHVALLHGSTSPFLQGLVSIQPVHSSQRSVISQFETSLKKLIGVLDSTTPHYVRCISPCAASAAKNPIFTGRRVLDQLRACGVMESIQISAAGLPRRLSYVDFLARYKMFQIRSTCQTACFRDQDIVRQIINVRLGTNGHDVRYGSSRVFLSDAHSKTLELGRFKYISSAACIIQTTWRMQAAYKRLNRLRRATVLTQRTWRRILKLRNSRNYFAMVLAVKQVICRFRALCTKRSETSILLSNGMQNSSARPVVEEHRQHYFYYYCNSRLTPPQDRTRTSLRWQGSSCISEHPIGSTCTPVSKAVPFDLMKLHRERGVISHIAATPLVRLRVRSLPIRNAEVPPTSISVPNGLSIILT